MHQGFGSDELRLSEGRAIRLSSSKIVWLLCFHVPTGKFHTFVQTKAERSPKVTSRNDAACIHALK